MQKLTADLLLKAYAAGIFPMADSADDPELFWLEPDQRGILPLDAFHVPRKLKRILRDDVFDIRCDTAFEAVIAGCAEATEDRPSTWINQEIKALCLELFARGHAHSVEAWYEGRLVGGLYGIALGGAFFGESMFSRIEDASKVALVHLVAHLIDGGFTLLDTQFVTDHLARFGAIEIPRQEYRRLLAAAMAQPGRFAGTLRPLGAGTGTAAGVGALSAGAVLGAGAAALLVSQSRTQTS